MAFLNEHFPTGLRATGTALSWNLGFGNLSASATSRIRLPCSRPARVAKETGRLIAPAGQFRSAARWSAARRILFARQSLRMKPCSWANTMACARELTPSLSNRFEA
jgi:hypothetical protein